MAVEIKRKLYKRGSSFETTIPMPLLFASNLKKKHDILFKYEKNNHKWYLEVQERKR
jgi:hypothetical protein